MFSDIRGVYGTVKEDNCNTHVYNSLTQNQTHNYAQLSNTKSEEAKFLDLSFLHGHLPINATEG